MKPNFVILAVGLYLVGCDAPTARYEPSPQQQFRDEFAGMTAEEVASDLAESLAKSGLPVTQRDGTVLESITADGIVVTFVYRSPNDQQRYLEILEQLNVSDDQFRKSMRNELKRIRCDDPVEQEIMARGIIIEERHRFPDGSHWATVTLKTCEDDDLSNISLERKAELKASVDKSFEEDVKSHARNVAAELAPNLPMQVSKNIVLENVVVAENVVQLKGVLQYDLKFLTDSAVAGGVTQDSIKQKMAANTQNMVCTDEQMSAFVRLGGEIHYLYFFNDGVQYMVIEIDDCGGGTR